MYVYQWTCLGGWLSLSSGLPFLRVATFLLSYTLNSHFSCLNVEPRVAIFPFAHLIRCPTCWQVTGASSSNSTRYIFRALGLNLMLFFWRVTEWVRILCSGSEWAHCASYTSIIFRCLFISECHLFVSDTLWFNFRLLEIFSMTSRHNIFPLFGAHGQFAYVQRTGWLCLTKSRTYLWINVLDWTRWS